MAKKTNAPTKRTKVKALPKSKRELKLKEMRKVTGGISGSQETPTEKR
jgi:hypothetical protein